MANICCICMPCHVSFLCVPHHDTLADSLRFAFVCRLGGVTIADTGTPCDTCTDPCLDPVRTCICGLCVLRSCLERRVFAF